MKFVNTKNYLSSTFIFFLFIFLSAGCTTENNTTTVIPAAPTNLSANLISTTQVNLTWTDNATNETGYKVQRKIIGGNFADIASTGPDIANHSDLGVTLNTTYTYRVYAYNSAGASLSYSNEVTVTTLGTAVLTTTAIANISNTTAKSGGTITSDGGSPITARGIVWSSTSNPTVALTTKTIDGTGIGSFISNLTGLTVNTTYYVRAYATNNAGTSYGSEISFKTLNVDITSGLVAYYPFNGNANDESGNNNNGVVNGNVSLTTDRFGTSNKAFVFPGSPSAYIECGSSNSLKITQNISLSAWIFMDGGYINPRILSFEGSSRTGYGMAVAGTSNTSRTLDALFVKGNGQGMGFCCGNGGSGIIVPSLSWQHIVFTGDNGVGKLYLNGQLIKTMTGVVVNESNYVNSLNIGRLSQSSFDAWGGKLDEIRIYNRALTQEEVTYVANN